MEAASLATIHELNAIVSRKGYGRDLLYRTGDSHYLLLRYWNSEQARATADQQRDIVTAQTAVKTAPTGPISIAARSAR